MATLAGLFFLLNRFHPLITDDYSYSFICGTDERIRSLSDIIVSQCHHWQTINGRFVVHCISQFFLMHDKVFFDIANTLALLCTAWGAAHLLTGRHQPGKTVAAAFVLALLILLMPSPGETMVWLDGSCNYLWALLLATLVILGALSPHLIARVSALLLAPLAGNAHEGISIALAAFLFIYALLSMRERRFLPLLYVTACLAAIGVALNVFSPGLHIRMSIINANTPDFDSAMAAMLFRVDRGARIIIDQLLYGAMLPICLMLAAGTLGLYWRRKQRLDKQNTITLCLLCAAFLQIGALLFSGGGGAIARAWVGVFYFSLLAALSCLLPCVLHSPHRQRLCLLLFTCGFSLFMMSRAVLPAHAHRTATDSILQQARDGNTLVVRPETPTYSLARFYHMDNNLSSHCLFYANQRMALYHGTRPFCVTTEEGKAHLALIPPDAAHSATDGNIILLPGGELLFSLPPDTRVVTISHNHQPAQEPRFSWPLGKGYGVLYHLSAEARSLEVNIRRADNTLHHLRLSESHLERLRREGHLPQQECSTHNKTL